jgi:DNA-binding CsgD family transcriptional regulator
MDAADQAGLRRVLAVVDLLIEAVDERELVPALLPLLLRAVPGDSVVWTPHPGSGMPQTLPAALLDPEVMAAFEREAATDPLVAHTRLGPGSAARRSDVQSRRALLDSALYAEVYRPVGAEHQLAMAFPAGYAGTERRRVCLVVNRAAGPDFTDADVRTAALLRVRLAHAMDRLARATPVAGGRPQAAPQGVTRREAAVLGLLADGLTNEQIARRLAISPRTVDKHLEHAYPKLHVAGRVAAANAWRDGERLLSAADRPLAQGS